MGVGRVLHLLIIEDVEDHALLLVRELQKAGIEPVFERVETRQELENALEERRWDAVISDFNLPGFDGLDALHLIQQKGLDLPFLLVSGAIGEEKAAEVMKAGAHDFIKKGNYARLAAVIDRELEDAAVRHERRVTAAELAKHRERLEELVQERTAELRRANEELEAFNRMVSHDLRQPLNVIGLATQQIKILCEDQMDDLCDQSVRVISDGIGRMNALIDTLLKFAGSTHTELRREDFNLGELAHSIVAEARLAEPGRSVTFRCAEQLPANGDPHFLRTALENLIGNAWKYTGNREEAVIEVGTVDMDGEQVFYVRDNGKGFDMADAAKLFIPFHRLSNSEQFKGFGIGLATVERIIRRHGGRIWAVGEPEQGATFYFTLSPRL